MGRNWRAVNVEREINDPASVLSFYKEVLQYRKGNALIRNGSFELLYPDSEDLFAYLRDYYGQCLLVLCNFSSSPISVPTIEGAMVGKVVLSNYSVSSFTGHLRPYEGIAMLLGV